MDKGEYLKYLLDRIESKTGMLYAVGTALRVNHASLFTAEEWEGDAVIFDPSLVRLIPFNRDNGRGQECDDWWQPRIQEEKNDCLPLGDPGPKVSKSVFEFPIGSGNHILFYNTHCPVSDPARCVNQAIDFMRARQKEFQGMRYPPILAGDLNTSATPSIQEYFVDPIQGNHIDHLLFGTYEKWKWEFDGLWWITTEYGPIALPPFDPAHTGRVYSDHPVMVAKLLYDKPTK